jgi:pimeloyl-ACP methyl ester carboxylesterase
MTDTSTTAPDWFNKAIAQPAESRFASLDGTPVHYLAWNAGDTHKPGLLFAHGFRAHARWWSFIAPFFLSRFRVVALDFPGMGDSGARAEYGALDFPRSLTCVLEQSGLGRSTLVGHSFGGSQVARAAAEFPDLVERAVIIDSFIPVLGVGGRRPPQLEARTKNVYASYDAARARFRLVPEQNSAAPYILDYVARHSMSEVTGGFSWKFDDMFVPQHREQDMQRLAAVVDRVRCPVTYVYGDQSIVVSRELAYAIVKQLQHGHGPIAIPQSHHHVLLDQPLALVSALRAILY